MKKTEKEEKPRPRITREEWRAQREARREKQRNENVTRAAKMHAARLAVEDGAVKPLLRAMARRKGNLPEIHVGCSGWFYWHWRGSFYPADLSTSRWFSHYAERFDTVELNAPFYSWPTVAAVRGWHRQIGRKKFHYTVKVSELITHVKRFSRTKTLVADFGHIADLLGPRMGCFLFQLPPSFHYSAARLNRILAQLDPARRNVIEFRHRSWWNGRVYDAFRQASVIFCSCSGPRLPNDLVVTAEDVYIRFHGVRQWYRHDYSNEELVDWATRIRASGAKRVWAYFNNDREAFAIKNARTFLGLLQT